MSLSAGIVQQGGSYLGNSANNNGLGWRVKLYRLNVDGSWDDCGTGRICCHYSSSSLDEPVLSDSGNCCTSENRSDNSCSIEPTSNSRENTTSPTDKDTDLSAVEVIYRVRHVYALF